MKINNNKEVVFHKLGDAFRYMMTVELSELARNNGEGKAKHFYATLSFMYLNHLISNSAADETHIIMYMESRGEETVNIVIEEVSKYLLAELEKNIDFSDFDDLVEKLNQYNIEDWYFCVGEYLIRSYALNSYLFNGMIYFIGTNQEETSRALRRIPVNIINLFTDLSFYEDSELLEEGFSKILAFDDKHGRIYLEMYNQENYFAYYDISKDNIVICRNRFLVFSNGMLWIVTKDNWIAFVVRNKIHRIREYHEGAKYEARKDCFYIYPSVGDSKFFYPYYLFFDGHTELADKNDYERILWDYISKYVIKNEEHPYILSIHKSKLLKNAVMPSKFSINDMMNSINEVVSRYDRYTNVKYDLLKNIFGILSKYLDLNEDYTLLWFVLCEANSYLDKEGKFPSEKLYLNLKKIDDANFAGENSLNSLLMNYDLLLLELVKKAEDDEHFKIDISDKPVKIGTFVRKKRDYIMFPVAKEEGMFVGSQIVPKVDLSCEEGIVTYDAYLNRSYVICNYELNPRERFIIVNEFNLKIEKVTFIIHEENKGPTTEKFLD